MRASVFLATLILVLSAPAGAETLVRLESPDLQDLQAVGIELPRGAEIRVNAVGLREAGIQIWPFRSDDDDGDDDWMRAFAWILDAETRRPVWRLSSRESSRVSGHVREGGDTRHLDAGRYEVYYYAGYGWATERDLDTERVGFWESLFSDRRDLDDIRDDLADCYVTVESPDLRRSDVSFFEVDGSLPDALLQLNRAGNSVFMKKGFALDRPAGLRVYANIELADRDDYPADYGWIVRAETREVVWQPRRSSGRFGGGGEKNRRVDDEIELEAGRYIVYFGTDDTHAFPEFNVGPPHDPFNWGISLLPGEGFVAGSLTTFDAVDPEPLLALDETGDDANRQQAFVLKRAGKLRVHSLGEYIDREKLFVDQGWIVNADSGDTVWSMTGRNTIGAGGADKNRMFDGVVDLDAGAYVVYYATDGSHAYRGFNRATPFEPAAWGVTLRPGPGFDRGDFELLDEAALEKRGGYLVRLVGVGDDERVRQEFTLDRPMSVRIRAVGEGTRGSMHDYGFIVEAETDRVVWEMHYGDTSHAGGDPKNRESREEIRLEAGSYRAIYVTDGSHAFGDWNAAAPRDPLAWGITIRPSSDL